MCPMSLMRRHVKAETGRTVLCQFSHSAAAHLTVAKSSGLTIPPGQWPHLLRDINANAALL